MLMLIYSIKDNISGKFDQPYLAHNIADVQRSVKWLLNKSEQFSINAGDYSVYKLGEFDLTSGIIEPKLDFICNVIDLKEVQY